MWWIFCLGEPIQLGLHTLYCTACVDEGVVTQIQGCEGLSGQICDPVMQLILNSGDQATIFTIQVVGDG